jgi:hypothetical protein
MTKVLEQEVRNRAAELCEYCHAPQIAPFCLYPAFPISPPTRGAAARARLSGKCFVSSFIAARAAGVWVSSKTSIAQQAQVAVPSASSFPRFFNGQLDLGRNPFGPIPRSKARITAFRSAKAKLAVPVPATPAWRTAAAVVVAVFAAGFGESFPGVRDLRIFR